MHVRGSQEWTAADGRSIGARPPARIPRAGEQLSRCFAFQATLSRRGVRSIRERSVSFAREGLVAPVEVAGAAVAPEGRLLDRGDGRRLAGLGRYLFDRLLTRPDANVLEARVAEVRLHAVHRLLDSRLLLALEQRMVLERVSVALVVLDRHRATEPRVPLLQIEVFLDDLRENRRCLYRHKVSSRGVVLVVGGHDNGPCSGTRVRRVSKSRPRRPVESSVGGLE